MSACTLRVQRMPPFQAALGHVCVRSVWLSLLVTLVSSVAGDLAWARATGAHAASSRDHLASWPGRPACIPGEMHHKTAALIMLNNNGLRSKVIGEVCSSPLYA